MPIDAQDAILLPPARRGRPVIAWAIILLVAGGLFGLHMASRPALEAEDFSAFEIQARALVGLASVGPSTPEVFKKQVNELDRGSVGQRLRVVVLAGELLGPKEALSRLEKLQDLESSNQVAFTPQDAETGRILGRLYHDYEKDALSAPTVSEADRRLLQQRLGWFGDLALNPQDSPNPAARAVVLAPARRLLAASGVLLFGGLIAGATGFTLLVLWAVLWRHMRSHFRTGSLFGGVYAETFAVWIVFYVFLGWLIRHFAPQLTLPQTGLLMQGISLSALAWPVLRGASWRQVCRDIGWTFGDQPFREPFCGILCYIAALPIVIVLLLATSLVLQLGPKWLPPPTHPIVGELLKGNRWDWLLTFLVASVGAPLVEETMFRGVLYRHLREATASRGRWFSVIVSALAAALVFASLHPQGLLGIPVLTALACGFTAAREWRGTLVSSMTVHALHNAIPTLIIILAAG